MINSRQTKGRLYLLRVPRIRLLRLYEVIVIKVFPEFSDTNYHLDLPFSVAVHLFVRNILTQVW